MDNETIAIKLQETTDRSLRNEGRIKKLEEKTETLNKLATSVELIALQMKTLNTNFNNLASDVEDLKEKPAKRWESIAEKAILAAVGVLVAYIAVKLGLM